MKRWVLDLSQDIPAMLETWDEWKGLFIRSRIPIFSYAEVDWDWDKIEEREGKLFYIEKQIIRNQSRFYGEGEMPFIGSFYIEKDRLKTFMSEGRLILEVYSEGEKVIVAINGTPILSLLSFNRGHGITSLIFLGA